MVSWVTGLVERLGAPHPDRQTRALLVVTIAVMFVLVATVVVAFDSLVGGGQTALQIGDVATRDIRSPVTITYESDVLTEQRRREATAAVDPILDPPDPNVARQQVTLLRQILDYISNVRRDPFAEDAQKITDLSYITALRLDAPIMETLVTMDQETWRAVDGETVNVLERVMREAISETDLPAVTAQLPTQVALRFEPEVAAVVVAIVEDLVRPNRFRNEEATLTAQTTAAQAIDPQRRSFVEGQVVVSVGTTITTLHYEALSELGLLGAPNRRWQQLGQALLGSTLVLIGLGLYIVRFQPDLSEDTEFLALLAGIFLIVLIGARIFSSGVQIYLYPTTMLSFLFVAFTRPRLAVISMMGMALLVGLMIDSSLEIAALVAFGGLVGALTLRRSDRLNNYFLAGLIVGAANMVVLTTFNLEGLGSADGGELGMLLLYALINGILAATAAVAGMYVITQVFNLPTSLKLSELSQPNQPLLQRLLREAPGTYQHSLQVANLCEQAANAIGANAELVRVAALYHDVGKMLNPAFFVENQADGVNPHDRLNDPYRSADIIISHVVDGAPLARQYKLPARLRDFVFEHHGTTLVAYFYNQAVDQAGDEESVDIEQFTYPGPKPQSRETAIMMLADSCESTVRARKPANKQEISDIVSGIVDSRMRGGQLDESNLTLNDLKTIRQIFVDMLQAVFHPRINYPTAANRSAEVRQAAPEPAVKPPEPAAASPAPAASEAPPEPTPPAETTAPAPRTEPEARPKRQTVEIPTPMLDDDDDSPLPEVPRLRRNSRSNGADTQEMKTQDTQTDAQDQSADDSDRDQHSK
ncbi:MAG: HDIG domain-containing protein [Chloroflexi bacterium]|nr:HDIG domain-containing protein [Chloroflexota bacterium]